MKVAFVSPFPPALSGIADYSEALLTAMRPLCEVTPVHPGSLLPESDIALYQIGNNPDHEHAYRAALEHPGVVVLHEANLHHLIASVTIKKSDWDGYLRECEYDGGPAALEFARRVRKLEVGPDYEGVPMLRRLLSNARGLIAHSDFVLGIARAHGYKGPAAKIPHGAWIPEVDRMGYRARLGVDESNTLIGIFGHLKPYKRIAESLRAFARLSRFDPHARLVLAGEAHPDLPLHSMIDALGIRGAVRTLGRIDDGPDFTGYIGACDIVLNLRYPTVGETSGTLLRAMGLGRAVIVSDVGAFAEFPDEACLRVPVGSGEEDLLFEYLATLTRRRDLASSLGSRARAWVERECPWPRVASLYCGFLQSVVEGSEWTAPATPAPPAEPPPVERDYVRSWSGGTAEGEQYIDTHLDRLEKTLSLVPPGGPGDRILEMGAYLQITPALQTRLGYGEVRGCYYGPAGKVDHREKVSTTGEKFACEIDLFDAEKDRFPYPDSHFATVLCCELIEHLPTDPMFLMAEANRVLRDGGHLIVTTPNIASYRALSAVLQGYHPGFFPAYLRPDLDSGDARHAREYTPKEIYRLMLDAGFTVVTLETGEFQQQAHPEFLWIEHMLRRYGMPTDLRGDGIYAVGRKTGPVRDRFPAWLYQ